MTEAEQQIISLLKEIKEILLSGKKPGMVTMPLQNTKEGRSAEKEALRQEVVDNLAKHLGENIRHFIKKQGA